MKLHEPKSKEVKITSNKMIMEYARDYVNCTNKKVESLELLNHVRFFKQVFLPCELVGKSGKEYTEASIDEIKSS